MLPKYMHYQLGTRPLAYSLMARYKSFKKYRSGDVGRLKILIALKFERGS